MKKAFTIGIALVCTFLFSQAQTYHSVAAFSYSVDNLTPKVIKVNPNKPGVIYVGSQNVNLTYKGYFDTYDFTIPDSVKRMKRMGIQTDSFGVTDFVFRGSDIYAIGSKGLQIINVANPTNPVLTKNIKTFKDGATTKTIGYFTASILVEGNRLHYGGSNYYLIDISDLNNPTKLAERSYPGINSGSIQQLSANKVLVGDGYNVNIFDVASPPTVTKTTLTSLFGDPSQLLYDKPNKILYTASGTSSQSFVYSVDMNTNNQLDSFNYLRVPGFDPSGHYGLCLFKDTLYVGTSQGIALFDVSNPSDLRFLGKLTTNGSSAVYVDDEFLITNNNLQLNFYRRGPAQTTSLHEQLTLSNIELFPNPAYQTLGIKFGTPSQPQIQIIDPLGKVITEWHANAIAEQHEIDISELKPGIYIIRLFSDDEWVSRKLKIE